jgi:5-methyltetrahydrofolate--homocysteine methyltransferase
MENILDRLKCGDVIVGDGALGTMLMQRGLKHREPPESFNILKPQVLTEIASLYLEAGSEIVSTNTFGASPLRLQQFSMEKDTEILNRNAVEAVRSAVGNKAYVSGSIGPSAKMIKPSGDSSPEKILASFKRQSSALLEAGVDMICIETMTDVAEAVLALQAVRSLSPKIPIMATVTFGKIPRGYFTLMGHSIKDSASILQSAGADIVGSNCGNGTEAMVEIAREFRKYTDTPIAIQSNAGLPASDKGVLVYPETPEYFSEKAGQLIDIGVQIIGGCCGTTPDHIRAVRKIVDARRLDSHK